MNKILIFLISILLVLVACKTPKEQTQVPTTPTLPSDSRVTQTYIDVGKTIQLTSKGTPSIFTVKSSIRMISGDSNDPLNVNETEEQKQHYCDCDTDKPCDPKKKRSCGKSECLGNCNEPRDPNEVQTGVQSISPTNPPDSVQIDPDDDPILSVANCDNPPCFYIMGPKNGLVDDYVTVGVNKIKTRSLMKLYENYAVYRDPNDRYMIVRDRIEQYVAIIGTQDKEVTLFLRSPSFPLLVEGGLRNVHLDGKPLVNKSKRK